MKQEWTGERLETFVSNETTIEHLHRYALAGEFVENKQILDIACGEGYGSNLIVKNAASVTGIDIDATTIEKARKKYTHPKLNFLTGDVLNIPCPDHSFDVVVSFETIEHIREHEMMLKEIKRVMKPGGLLIISTPDKKNYTDKTGYNNPFHKHELYTNEFETLLKSFFNHVQLCSQQMTHSSLIRANNNSSLDMYTGDYATIEKNAAAPSLYNIALASQNQLPFVPNSVFNGNSVVEKLKAETIQMVTNTITFRTGRIILYPFKVIRNIFKKS